MTLNRLHPFLFDTDFDRDDAPYNNAADECGSDEALALEREQALAAAHATGYAEGHRIGLAEVEAANDRHIANALEGLNGQIGSLAADLAQREKAMAQQSAIVAAAICRRFLPPLYRQAANDGIAEFVAAFLPRIGDTPKLIVRVAETIAEPIADRLNELAHAAGFSGLIETLGDAQLEDGDCRIEWPRGGAVRDAATLWRQVDALLEDSLGASPPATAPLLPFPTTH